MSVRSSVIASIGMLTSLCLQPAVAGAAEQQIITTTTSSFVGPSAILVPVADVFSIDINYNTSTGSSALSGLGLRLHFDSSQLTFDGANSVLGASLIGQQGPIADTGDLDQDASTDMMFTVAWAAFASDWPGGALPQKLFSANFTTAGDFTAATLNFSASDNAVGFELQADAISVALLIDSDGDDIPDVIDEGDTDGDGMSDAFETTYAFLDPQNNADGLEDFDGDGISNFVESRVGTLLDDINSTPGAAYSLNEIVADFSFTLFPGDPLASSATTDRNCITDLGIYIDTVSGNLVTGPNFSEVCTARNYGIADLAGATAVVSTFESFDVEPECENFPCIFEIVRSDNIIRSVDDQQILISTADSSAIVSAGFEEEIGEFSYNFAVITQQPLTYSDDDLTGTYYLPLLEKGFFKDDNSEFNSLTELTLTFDGAGSCSASSNLSLALAHQASGDAHVNRLNLAQTILSFPVTSCGYTTQANGAVAISVDLEVGDGTTSSVFPIKMAANSILAAGDFSGNLVGFPTNHTVSLFAGLQLDATTTEGQNDLLSGSYLLNGHFGFFGNSTVPEGSQLSGLPLATDSDGSVRSIISFDSSTGALDGYSECSVETAVSAFGRSQVVINSVQRLNLRLKTGERSTSSCRYKVMTDGLVDIETTKVDFEADDLDGNQGQTPINRTYRISSDHNVLLLGAQINTGDGNGGIASLSSQLLLAIKYTGADIETIRRDFLNGVGPDIQAPVVTPPLNLVVASSCDYKLVYNDDDTVQGPLCDNGTVSTFSVVANFLVGAIAHDNFDGVITTLSNDAPALFPIGDTTVTFTAIDAAGNVGTATATVTVDNSLESDGDGVLDIDDALRFDITETGDADGDGKGDNADLDDDNDGAKDLVDGAPKDPRTTLAPEQPTIRIAPGKDINLTVKERTFLSPTGESLQVPANATAVSLNVTVVNPSSAGFVTVWPCDVARPTVSSVNYTAGAVVPNGVLVPLGDSGEVCFFSLSNSDLVIDVSGWFVGTAFTGITPTRVVDSRDGTGTPTAARITPSEPLRIQVTGRVVSLPNGEAVTVPQQISAASINVTVVTPEGAGFLTVYPCDVARPLSANVNYVAGDVVGNGAVASVSASGEVCIYSFVPTDIVVDFNGWFSEDSFTGVTPNRRVDTRDGTGGLNDLLDPFTELVVPIHGIILSVNGVDQAVPNTAKAVALNVTAVQPLAPGFITVWPCGVDRPLAANVNYVTGAIVANNVLAPIGDDGTVCLYSFAPTNLVVDVLGWFEGSDSNGFIASTPTRTVDTRTGFGPAPRVD